MGKNGRDKALDMALANLTKRFGEGTVMRLGEATHLQVEIIPTGSLAIDRALGVGGSSSRIFRRISSKPASRSSFASNGSAPTSIW